MMSRLGLDLDGTLITCKSKQMQLLEVIIKAYKVNINCDEVWELKSEGYSNLEAMLKLGVDKYLAKSIQVNWVDQVETMPWIDFDDCLPHTIEALTIFKKKYKSIHLISARNNKRLAKYQISKLQLDKYFDTINFVSYNFGEQKSKFIKRLNIDIYIGDTEADYHSCLSAGCQSVLVSTGMRSHKYLTEETNSEVYHNLAFINI